MKIVLNKSKLTEGEYYTQRVFNIVVDNKVVHSVKHTHFKGWGIYSAPKNRSMQDYQKLIKEATDFVSESYFKTK